MGAQGSQLFVGDPFCCEAGGHGFDSFADLMDDIFNVNQQAVIVEWVVGEVPNGELAEAASSRGTVRIVKW